MAESNFLRRFTSRFPVSYLFLEIFARVAENSPESTVSAQLTTALTQLRHPAPYSEALLLGILDDMQALRAAREKRNAGAPKKSPGQGSGKKAPGSGLSKWLGDRDIESLLMLATNGDYDVAYKLYAEAPAMLVDQVLSDRIEMEMQRFSATFEAVVYGTGGSMKESNDARVFEANAETGKMSDATKEGLRSLGFM